MGEDGLTHSLAGRLQDIPGVASVTIDLEDIDKGIDVRLEPGADVAEVLERILSLLVAYGVRSADFSRLKVGRSLEPGVMRRLGVDVRVVPTKGGARVEVATPKVRSSRLVRANPSAIAQGLADAWCQVMGKVPVEIMEVSLGDQGELKVVASDGVTETSGTADVAGGWSSALVLAVGRVLGVIEANPVRAAAGW